MTVVTVDRNGASVPHTVRPLPAEAFTDEATYRHTRLPVDRASTLIRDAYTSRQFFDVEKQRVFASRGGGQPRHRHP